MNRKETLIFLLGFLACAVLVYLFVYFGQNLPFGNGLVSAESGSLSDFVGREDILVYDDYVLLKIKGATVSTYAPSGSMAPLLNSHANGIRIVPADSDKINVGDIVSYKLDDKLIVHRVVEKGKDDGGVYYVVKGDNNSTIDGKIRFEDIKYVTVAVVW